MTSTRCVRSRPEFSPDGLVLDGECLPILSGEIHYWRCPPETWRPALEYLKLSGANCVSTYVPWDFHEIDEGYTSLSDPLTYDFTGVTDPRRNLAGFLELADRIGLKAIIRPGPLIIAEWRHKGPPLHAFAFDWPDPAYTTALRRWYRAVGPVIDRYAWQNGGPIVCCQPDNEGHELTTTGFAMYLREHYPTVRAFDDEFGLDFDDYRQAAEALCECAAHNVLQEYVVRLRTDDAALLRLKGIAKEWFHNQFLAVVHREIRAAGVDLPFVINVIGSPVSANYHHLQTFHDTIGMDLYSPECMRGGYWYMAEYAGNYFAHAARYPYMAEFGACGFLRAWFLKLGPVSGRHLERQGLLYWANGIKGFNYYMFMDRDQCYGSPLDAGGRPTDNYFNLMHMHRVLRRVSFNRTRKVQKLALLWVRDWALEDPRGHRAPDRDWREWASHPQAFHDHPAFRRLHVRLVDLDASFAIVELAHADRYRLDEFELLLLPDGPFLPEDCRQALDALPAATRDKIRVVGEGDGFGLPKADLDGLLAAQPDAFHSLEVRQPGIRSFVHRCEAGHLLFLFNRTDRRQAVPLPATDGLTALDLWTLERIERPGAVELEPDGDRVFLLTHQVETVLEGHGVVAMEFE